MGSPCQEGGKHERDGPGGGGIHGESRGRGVYGKYIYGEGRGDGKETWEEWGGGGCVGPSFKGGGGGGKLLSCTEPVSHSLAVLSILYCISVSMTAFTFITAVTPVDR